MKFKHLMLDLETMSTQSNAAIIAIAAVPFEPSTGEVCESLFYEIIDLRNQDLFDRDVRTIVELGRQAGIDPKNDFPFAGVAHDALDDALHQVNYVSAIHQHLIKAIP